MIRNRPRDHKKIRETVIQCSSTVLIPYPEPAGQKELDIFGYNKGTPTKRQVSKRQVSKRLVSKRLKR